MRIATREAFGEILTKLGEKNENIVVLDSDLSGSTKTSSFKKKFPERFFNMGIAEADMMGTAAGFAISGKIPFAASFSIFSTGRAWDQIRNTICYSNLPVRIIGTHAGILTGEDGATHQSLEDIAILRSIPNITIVQPADALETRSVFEELLNHKGPVYFRLTRSGVPVVHSEDYKFKLGKNTILKKGKDIVIFATGAVVYNALSAAQKLEENKISATVVNVSSLKPVDEENIKKMCETHKMAFTVEDHSVIGGLGSIVSDVISENGISCILKKIGMTTFGESGTTDDLYSKYGLDADGILKTIKTNFKK